VVGNPSHCVMSRASRRRPRVRTKFARKNRPADSYEQKTKRLQRRVFPKQTTKTAAGRTVKKAGYSRARLL
jgi:hypothetical protein